MEGASGVGMLFGGVIIGVWGGFHRRIVTSLIGIIFMGLSLLLLGLTPGALFWLALVSAFVMGFVIPFVDGPILAIMQANVDPDMQARVFTMMGSLLAITSPIGLLIAGPLSDIVDIQIWFLASGLACLAAGIALYLIPSVIHIEDDRGRATVDESLAADRIEPGSQ